MECLYLIIMRASSTDVTALAELGLGKDGGMRHLNTINWPEFDQVGFTIATKDNQIGLLASLLSRGKLIWFQVIS